MSYVGSLKHFEDKAALVPIYCQYLQDKDGLATYQRLIADSRTDDCHLLARCLVNFHRAGVELHDALVFSFVKLMRRPEAQLNADSCVQTLTRACLLTKAVRTEKLIAFHLEHLDGLKFDAGILKELLRSTCPESRDSLIQAYKKVKLARDGFTSKQIIDRIELCNILAGAVENPLADAEFVRAIYLHCFQANISLTFFRLKNVLFWLGALVQHGIGDRDFWLKTEDYILRSRKQYRI